MRKQSAAWRAKAEKTLQAVERKAGVRVRAIEKTTQKMMHDSYGRIQCLQKVLMSIGRLFSPVPGMLYHLLFIKTV